MGRHLWVHGAFLDVHISQLRFHLLPFYFLVVIGYVTTCSLLKFTFHVDLAGVALSKRPSVVPFYLVSVLSQSECTWLKLGVETLSVMDNDVAHARNEN